ncbi:MAG: hypothetical protein DRN30_00510 [Thermoplasmata archaeon]|nr:MAG: hypothetical protein DRN30_00510 [Thermoplasmata archaeon]
MKPNEGECLKLLQNAFNNLKSVDNRVLSRWTKYRIYLRMNFVYNLIEEVGCSENALQKITEVLKICRARYIKDVGKREFLRKLNLLLDDIINDRIKLSKAWKQIRLSAIFLLLTYLLAGIGNSVLFLNISWLRALFAFITLSLIGIVLFLTLRWTYSRDFIVLSVILSVLIFYSFGFAYISGNVLAIILLSIALSLDAIAIALLMKNRAAFK